MPAASTHRISRGSPWRTDRSVGVPPGARHVLLILGLALALAGGVALLAPAAVLAAPGDSGDLSSLEGEISTKRAEAREIESQVQSLDEDVSILVEEYNQAVYFLERAEADEAAAVERVASARQALDESQQRLMERLDSVYRRGPLGLLDVLFGGRDLGGLTQRIRYFRDIADGDRKHVEAVKRYKAKLETEQAALEAERDKRASIAADLEQKRGEVESRLAERQQVLASVESDLADLIAEDRRREEERARIAAEAAERARREAAQAAAREAAAQTAAAQTETAPAESPRADDPPAASEPAAAPAPTTPKTSPPTTAQPDPPPAAPSSRGGRIVDIANQYLGVPYVWAGASPSGFDCSGLTQYVLAKVGVSLPHSSRLQFQMGTPVGRSNLAPGDLVFFGNPVHHVGIYAGGGQYIHAPYTGEVVKYSPFNRSDFVGGRRF